MIIDEVRNKRHLKKHLRTLNVKEVLIIPKRWRICISWGRWLSKVIRKKLRSPWTHETGIQAEELRRWWSNQSTRFSDSSRSSKRLPIQWTFHLSSSFWTEKFNLFPLSHIDVMSATFADLEIAQENDFMAVRMSTRTEICQFRGQVSRFTLLRDSSTRKNQPDGRLAKFSGLELMSVDENWESRRTKNWANREIVVPCKRPYSRTCVRYRCSKITRVEVSEAKFICVDIAGERPNSV